MLLCVCVREYLGKVKLLSFQLLTHPAIIFGWSQISNSIPILRGKIVRFLLVKSIMTHIFKKIMKMFPITLITSYN